MILLLQGTAGANAVTAMPTFVFFKGGAKIDMLRGANASELEEKIKKWYGGGEGDDEDTPVKGHVRYYSSKIYRKIGQMLVY